MKLDIIERPSKPWLQMKCLLAARICGLLAVFVAAGAVESSPPAEVGALTVTAIADRIRSQAEALKPPVGTAYTNQIPGTKASYAMMPIPGGDFVMGSSAGSRNAQPDEMPAHVVRLEPFWMGRCEVTWNEYSAFVYDDIERRQAAQPSRDGRLDSRLEDAITHPSLPYVDMDFGMGKNGYPAIAMTQHAANKYCQWLSAKTGHCYRLPTEAEWEYAARAGSSNIWFFGDDEAKLGNYAWFEENSDFKYQKVGRKLPNAWGLQDVLGNVSEWVLDQHDDGYYRRGAELGKVVAPWNKAVKQYPHSVRGGSWRDALRDVRCAVRGRSTPEWKVADPQLPKSRFWLRNCDFVGFRIVRPVAIPSTEEMHRCWNSGVELE